MSTLNENILKVKETFEDIASAIEEQGVNVGECESPTTYANKIRSIVGTGGGLNPEKLYVEAYDAGDSEPSVEASPTEDGGVMLTFGLRRGVAGTDGKDGSPGQDGTDGKDGDVGPQGPAGPAGKDGADGMDGSVYEYIYYQGKQESDKPSTPSGENVDDYVPSGWSDKAQGVDAQNPFEWRSERKKEDNVWGTFTDPILWAKYGEKGKDGDGVQYIYITTTEYKRPDNPTPSDYLTNTEYQTSESDEWYPLGWSDDPIDVDATNSYCWVSVRKYRNNAWGPCSTPALWAKYGHDGAGGDGTDGYRVEFIYKRYADETVHVEKPSNTQEDLFVPESEGWTNNPCGVTDDLQVEYVCQREKVDGIWKDWSNPAVWAMYGKIGRDGNGVEYIFKLTESEFVIPDQPVAPAEGNEQYPKDWNDNPLSVTSTMTCCWVSTRHQYYIGDKQVWSEYTTPAVWARYGKDGKDGGGRTVFLYTGSSVYEPSPAIVAPQGGIWDVETNTLSGVTTNDEYEWSTTPPVKSETIKYIWQSVGSFNSAGSLVGEWSAPFCITGENGRDGTDGISKEFIYRRVSNKDNFVELKEYLSNPDNKLEKTATNVVPDTKDNICKSVWTDEPQGIDGETYLIEVVCSRKAVLDENSAFAGWGDWSDPTIWAMWGEDGNDGPGVEYIFRITGPNATSEELYNEFISSDIFNHTRYQEDGFYPGNEYGIDLDWADEPQDVDKDQPLEWVSIRKGIVNQETGKVTWGEFSEPKVWGKYSEDGYSYKTSYVFARSNEPLEQPRGGDYQHDYPTVDGTTTGERNPIWYDSVPEGDAIIWMSNRTFRSDNNLAVDDDWSTPVKMSDTASFQVEFTATDLSKLSDYKPSKFTGDETAWRTEESAKGVDWADDVPGALYMATATCKNGVWNDWVVVRIKGEKGDKGADGTSVKIEGNFATLVELQTEWATYIANPELYSNGKFIIPLEQGDGYIVEENGHLWVYDGNGTVFKDAWLDAGKIQGASAMIYIRFANNADGSDMFLEGTPGKYIGIVATSGEVDEEFLKNYQNYTWRKWSGDDGWGYEQIFIATTTNDAPKVPSESKQIPDWVPDGWSDKPISVSEINPFVWYVTRKTEGDWAWKGDKDSNNNGYAALYSRYSYDGEAFHLELTNDQAILPLENGAVDTDFDFQSATTTMVLYAGDHVVDSGVSYRIDNTDAATLSDNVVTLNGNAANVSEIECIATYKDVDYKKTFHILKTANAFDIVTDKVVLERNPETGYLVDSDKELLVWPKRWNGQKWSIANGKILFVTCYHTDGSVDDPESYNVEISNSIKIDLKDELNLSKVRLFFTSKNTVESEEICYEEVGVVANGKQGPQGETGVFSDTEKQALLNEALENINKSYYSMDQIDELEEQLQKAINDGCTDAIAHASAALDKANSFNEELNSLKSKFKTDEFGKTYLDSSALNVADIYSLSVAALGNDIADSEGTLHEEAVFAKQIVGVISQFGSVKADNITGDVISGKTVQSSDEGGWKLNNAGDGYLANKNISWDKDGTVTFGSGVSLKWSDIQDKPDLNELSKSDVVDIINSTQIDGSNITTGTISAERFNVKEIAAEVAKVGELSAKSLNTTSDVGAGTIYIKDNELKVYNENSAIEVLNVTGKEISYVESPSEITIMSTESNRSFDHDTSLSDLISNTVDSGGTTHTYLLNKFTIPNDGYTYRIGTFNPAKVSIGFYTNDLPSKLRNMEIDVNCRLVIIPNNMSISSVDYNTESWYAKTVTVFSDDNIIDYEETQDSITLYTTEGHEFGYNDGACIEFYNTQYNHYSVSQGSIIPVGEYDLYLQFNLKLNESWEGTNNPTESDLQKINVSNGEANSSYTVYEIKTYVSEDQINRLDISPYGFRYIASSTKYAELTKEGTFLFRNGNNIFAIDNYGIGVNFEGNSQDLQRVVTKTFTFRVRDYDDRSYARVSIPILCIDGQFEADTDL